jgi:hypothetical protein
MADIRRTRPVAQIHNTVMPKAREPSQRPIKKPPSNGTLSSHGITKTKAPKIVKAT